MGYSISSSTRGKAAPLALLFFLLLEQRKVNGKQNTLHRSLHGEVHVCQGTPGHWSSCPHAQLSTHHCPPLALLLPGLRVTLQLQAEPLGLAQGHAHRVLCQVSMPMPRPPISCLSMLSHDFLVNKQPSPSGQPCDPGTPSTLQTQQLSPWNRQLWHLASAHSPSLPTGSGMEGRERLWALAKLTSLLRASSPAGPRILGYHCIKGRGGGREKTLRPPCLKGWGDACLFSSGTCSSPPRLIPSPQT